MNNMCSSITGHPDGHQISTCFTVSMKKIWYSVEGCIKIGL